MNSPEILSATPIKMVEVSESLTDNGEKRNWKVKTTVEKFSDRKSYESKKPFDVVEIEGNALMNAGINSMFTLIGGGVETPYDNANSFIGVGDGSAVEDPAHTDLQGTSKLRKGMEVGYPVYGSDQKIIFRSVFSESEANFDWREWAVFNHASAGKIMNRKVANSGTKANGAIWTFTVEISLS